MDIGARVEGCIDRGVVVGDREDIFRAVIQARQ